MSFQNIDDLCNELTVNLSTCLADGRTDDALSIIYNSKYDQCLRDKSWDLIPAVSKYLVQETINNSPKVYDCCEIILEEIAQKSNPEEALLEFLEQAENFENDVKFCALLKPLQIILFKLPKRRGQSLEWCLNMIQSHVNALPLPRNYSLEGEEKKLMDSDPCVVRIINIYKEIVPFYKPFVNEVSLRHNLEMANETNREIQRKMIVCFILQLLNKPLVFLDLECDSKSSSAVRFLAEDLVHFLTCLLGDLTIFLEYVEMKTQWRTKTNSKINKIDSDDEDECHDMFAREDKVSDLSIAMLYYLIFAEQIELAEIPCIYSPLYIFQQCLNLIVVLLRHAEEFVIRKGLLLANAVLGTLSEGSISHNVLESSVHSDFVESLSKVMVYCEVEELRKSAVLLLRKYLFIFNVKGQYLLMSNLPSVVNHSGILGYLITQLKDMIINTLESGSSSYFTGKTLYDLISNYCSLQHGAETDLVENVDQIVSALNLVRFLALRDQENKTGMWNYVGILQKSMLEPLRDGIKLSRAHYNLKLKDLEEEKKNALLNEKGDMKSDVTITVGGQQLPNMPIENKISVVLSALNAFDLMESLLSRVNECIDIGTSRLKL